MSVAGRRPILNVERIFFTLCAILTAHGGLVPSSYRKAGSENIK